VVVLNTEEVRFTHRRARSWLRMKDRDTPSSVS